MNDKKSSHESLSYSWRKSMIKKETIKRTLLTIILILAVIILAPSLQPIFHFFVMNLFDLFCQGVAGAMIVLACWIMAGDILNHPWLSGTDHE